MSHKLVALLSVLIMWSIVTCVDARGQAFGISYYFDSREFNTFAVSVSASNLWEGISLWGFTDLHSQHKDQPHRYDLTRSFSEYRLSRNLFHSPTMGAFGVQFEYNDVTPGQNAVGRCGLTLKRTLPIAKGSWLQLRALPVETTSGRAQVSLIYFIRIQSWIHISGFADCNLREHETTRWVVEPQATFLINQRVSVLVEYRYNGFEEHAPGIDGAGVALGLGARF